MAARRLSKGFGASQKQASIENPHFRAAIDNYAALLSAMDLSQDTIAARVSSAIKGEPDESA